MHGSLVVAPYVFIFAVVAGYVRVRTGSTFNTITMHSLNNLMLYVRLRISMVTNQSIESLSESSNF